MRKSLRRWLLHRRSPRMKPLCQRVAWGDFEHRMRRAIAIDVAVDLGLVSRTALLAQQMTRQLPALDFDHSAPTEYVPGYWFYADQTIPDLNATQPEELVLK